MDELMIQNQQIVEEKLLLIQGLDLLDTKTQGNLSLLAISKVSEIDKDHLAEYFRETRVQILKLRKRLVKEITLMSSKHG